MRTTHVRVSACNLMISSRNFDDAGSAGRGEWRREAREREEGEPGLAKGESEQGGGGRNARPEERTSECGRELVRAGAFPRANFRVRDGGGEERGEKQRECDRDQARKRGRKREEERERERKRTGRER